MDKAVCPSGATAAFALSDRRGSHRQGGRALQPTPVRAGNTGPFLDTIHTSCITLGIIIGSGLESAVVPAFGLRAPVFLGAVPALCAVATVVPAVRARQWGPSGRTSEPERPVG